MYPSDVFEVELIQPISTCDLASSLKENDVQAIFVDMFEVGPENVIEFLHDTGRLQPSMPATAHALAWGVSNVVLRVEPQEGPHFVIKQSREQLRTKTDWFSRIDRIFREIEAMRVLDRILPDGVVPRILFEDRENYLFAMEAVPADHVVWKAELLAGTADTAIARTAADYLAIIHTQTCNDVSLRGQMADGEVFDQLRIDPFYRHVATKHPQATQTIEHLIDEMQATRICLVHADFSPKNILVIRSDATSDPGLALVDFETAHFGDPAFDLGFFFSHLLLKSVLHADKLDDYLALARVFHQRYFGAIDQFSSTGAISRTELDHRAVGHTAVCMLARIDGKSTIDYLPNPADQQLVRAFCLSSLADLPAGLISLFDRLAMTLREGVR